MDGFDREHLPLCVRCRQEINALPTRQRVWCITRIRESMAQQSQAVSLQQIRACLKAIADHVECEYAWELGEDELEGEFDDQGNPQ